MNEYSSYVLLGFFRTTKHVYITTKETKKEKAQLNSDPLDLSLPWTNCCISYYSEHHGQHDNRNWEIDTDS